MKHVLAAILAAFSTLAAVVATAHEMTIAEMEVRQVSRNEFIWRWAAIERGNPNEELAPVWPDGCVAQAVDDASVLRCGQSGLSGTMTIEGVGKRYSAAMVKVFWLDAQSRVYTFTTAQPKVRLFGSADDQRGWDEIALAYAALGVEHILSGIDHLLFVIALLFLVGFNRRLFWTITAFTAAHSVTLALSALDLLTLRSPPVEASIALSIVLVAGEALQRRATLARQAPAVVAFLFGLVHGLGFAGALKEIGLPQQHLAVALLTFNVGVEVGQLLVVGLAYVIYRAAIGFPKIATARAPVLYAIGSVAAYWSIARVVTMLG